MEAEAVLAILRIVNEKNWTLVTSDVIDLELSNMKNTIKRNKIDELCRLAYKRILTTDSMAARADELQKIGFKALDSFHLAIAEYSNVDVFLSTDDKLVSLANKVSLPIKVVNPLKWLSEVL